MPKINVYVPDEMLEWIRDNDIKISAEFQHRIKEIQGVVGDDGIQRKVITRVRVRDGLVKIRPGRKIVGYVEDGGNQFIIFAE